MLLFYYAIDEADAGVLTDTPTNLSQDNLDVSLMIPQPLTALSTANRAVSGNYIQVDCEIFDTASGAKIWQNAKTDPSLLVAETDYGKIYFPLTTETLNEWQAGHAYIYKAQINNAPDVNPITFDVAVKSYIYDSTSL